jgi:preprotein translocase subunit SecF
VYRPDRSPPWALLVIAEFVGWVVLATFRDSWPAIMVGIVVATLVVIFVAVGVWTWRQRRRPE